MMCAETHTPSCLCCVAPDPLLSANQGFLQVDTLKWAWNGQNIIPPRRRQTSSSRKASWLEATTLNRGVECQFSTSNQMWLWTKMNIFEYEYSQFTVYGVSVYGRNDSFSSQLYNKLKKLINKEKKADWAGHLTQFVFFTWLASTTLKKKKISAENKNKLGNYWCEEMEVSPIVLKKQSWTPNTESRTPWAPKQHTYLRTPAGMAREQGQQTFDSSTLLTPWLPRARFTVLYRLFNYFTVNFLKQTAS